MAGITSFLLRGLKSMNATLSLYSAPDTADFEDVDDIEPLAEIEQEHEAKPQVWSSFFLDELKFQAKKFIKNFFAGKQWYCGGSIDPDVITSEHYINFVLNTDVEAGVQMVYDYWHTAPLGRVTLKEIRQARLTGDVPSDVEAVLAVQRACNALNVPKAFRGGITAMYFEFCEGFDYSVSALPVLGVA